MEKHVFFYTHYLIGTISYEYVFMAFFVFITHVFGRKKTFKRYTMKKNKH